MLNCLYTSWLLVLCEHHFIHLSYHFIHFMFLLISSYWNVLNSCIYYIRAFSNNVTKLFDTLTFKQSYLVLLLNMLTKYLIKTIVHHNHSYCLLQRIHFVSDPCTLLVNNVTIGLSSMDILLHLGSEETVW